MHALRTRAVVWRDAAVLASVCVAVAQGCAAPGGPADGAFPRDGGARDSAADGAPLDGDEPSTDAELDAPADDAPPDGVADARADVAADVPADPAGDGAGPQAPWRAPVFDGRSGYVEIPDDAAYSVAATGAITVEAWMRPDSLAMPAREGSGYVHWLGKGDAGQHEWVARMYQQGNSEGRANRVSFYAFNLAGGLGAGSYFEDPVRTGEWIHYAGVIDATRTYVFKNGELRDSDLLSEYDITPRDGTAPVRIGTRDLASFFQGAVARVAIYGARLADARIAAHHAARAAGTYDAVVMAEPSLVGFWRLAETSGTVAVDARAGRNGRYVGGVRPGGATWAVP